MRHVGGCKPPFSDQERRSHGRFPIRQRERGLLGGSCNRVRHSLQKCVGWIRRSHRALLVQFPVARTRSMLGQILPFLVLMTLLGAGIILTVATRPRYRAYPSCRRCGYNLAGIVGDSQQCPECGSSITIGEPCPGGKPSHLRSAAHTAGFLLTVLSAAGLVIMVTALTIILIKAS